MFDELRSAFTKLKAALTKRTLSESEVDDILWDFELSLLKSDVAKEVVEEILSKIKAEVTGKSVERLSNPAEYIKLQLIDLVKGIFSRASSVDLMQLIRAKKEEGQPFVAVFLGIHGTGKSTSIAKLAHLLKRNEISSVLACADTHRAGAIEQLSEHARRLSVKLVSQKYGADPAAVARDAVLYAKAHRIDAVLIDTAGRMQTSRNLMEGMAKIVRVVNPDLKIFVGDSLAGNDAVSQAREFLKFTDFDAAILTKADADVKGGSALSISSVTGRPIIYLGVGQRYEDLVPFDAKEFVSTLFEER